ncbi:MAG: hypothetical protein Q7T78_02015 [Rhodoferax sp.]|nr:hypothetical protein [Rhodoferax sp.]
MMRATEPKWMAPTVPKGTDRGFGSFLSLQVAPALTGVKLVVMHAASQLPIGHALTSGAY